VVVLGARLRREPNRLCWITGNLERTSALYILMRPVKTLGQAGTAEMFHSWLLCSGKGPLFTLQDTRLRTSQGLTPRTQDTKQDSRVSSTDSRILFLESLLVEPS